MKCLKDTCRYLKRNGFYAGMKLDLASCSILHLCVIVFFFSRLSSAWRLGEMFPTPFMPLYVAPVKSETIIYNVFPPDVWLTPWVNETLASPVCVQNGYLIIHLLLSSWFSFFFLRLYVAALRRSEKRVVKPWRAYSGAIPGAALPPSTLSPLPSRSDSFHSSAFDHPRRRIRYSNASESARLSLPPTPFRPFSLNPILSSHLSPFRGVTSVTVGCWLHEPVCTLSLVLLFPIFILLFFSYLPLPPCIRE